jgi:aspartyl-tRNA synthetase
LRPKLFDAKDILQMKRTHTCGDLRKDDIGKTVCLKGWVDRRRDLGGVIFIDLRDKFGKTQVVFDPELNPENHKLADTLRNEFVIEIEGVVRQRPEGMENAKLDTGDIDIASQNLKILNKSAPLPLSINDFKEESKENEELRLKYRYLELRRPWVQKNVVLKSQFLYETHHFFHDNGFEEIETPVLCKSTPEGARDYLVPSRVNPGTFYALPQSPQTYKQLLMIAGMDRYYQIAKCFRDEDLRADRQPEFMQIDCEMSFVEEEDIYEIFDKYIRDVLAKVWKFEAPEKIQRMPYAEAMLKYGSDKPDLRFGLEIADVSEIAGKTEFGVFKNVVAGGGVVRGLAAKGCLDFTRKNIDDLTEYVGRYGAKGLVWMRVKEDGIESQVAKFFTDEEIKALGEACGAEAGDMLFFIAGPEHTAATATGQLRLKVAEMKEMADPSEYKFVWITDFPMFEYSETAGRFTSMHHPFTAPTAEDLPKLLAGEKKDLIAQAYDLVLNGVEIGGGSIRIHDPEVQQQVFKALGLSDEEVQEKFGYFVDAFKYGAPPHGGLAFGVDRIIATMEGKDNIRDFIPFPKNTSAVSPMENSPSPVAPDQLHDVHITLAQSALENK